MALSWSEQILPAGSQTVPVEIAYLDRTYIHLYVNGAEQTDFTWDSNTLIRFGTQLDESSTVTIVRRTERSYLYILFAEGAAFIKENLDTQNTQFLHLAQELVEGRAIEGFYGNISMNGYKITNLGAGTELTDAVNVGQLNAVEAKVDSVLGTVIADTVAYPWYTITEATTSIITPPYTFNNAAVYIGGVCQTPGYSYSITDSVITLADPVPAGTHIFCRLGEDVPNEQGYATAASLSSAVDALEASIAAEAAARDAADTMLQTNINAKLDAMANAVSATKLATARTIQTNLAVTTAAPFDGTANVTPGVTGILPVANGGTGASSSAGARNVLGAAASGVNPDITQLTGLTGGITGLTSGFTAASTAGSGIVGETIGDSAAASATTLTSVALAGTGGSSVHTITLTAGVWLVTGSVQYNVTAAANTTGRAFSISTVAATQSANWWDVERMQNSAVTSPAGITTHQAPTRLITATASTPIYLVANATFSAGTVTALGYLKATRIR